MRIIAGGLEHETNSFSNISADKEHILRIMSVGDDYVRGCTGVRCMMGGFIDECRELGIELIPKLNFSATHHTWLCEYGQMMSTSIYYKACREIIKEVYEAFDHPRYFHLGIVQAKFFHCFLHENIYSRYELL